MTTGPLPEMMVEAAPATTEKEGTPKGAAQDKSPACAPRSSLSTIESEGSLKKEKGASGKEEPGPLDWTGRPFGGITLDIRRRGPYYVSDWTDAFLTKNLGKAFASVLFLFFACISPAITFGNLYEKDSNASFGVVETTLATAISGVLYSIMSGQPITILGATGPIFAYTIVCYDLSKTLELEFLPFYFWTLMWCSFLTVLMVACDLCALMHQVTKFSEDIFAGLISLIFIVEAIKPAVKGFLDPDKSRAVAFLELVLLVVTYRLSHELSNIRTSPWLTTSLRGALANFGVFLAIVLASALAAVWRDVPIDMLQISGSFSPTLLLSDGTARSWLVSPLGEFGDFPAWAIFFAALPAVGFAVLGYLDQNLTTVLVNRPGNKLKKPPAYHLDFFIRGVVCTPICALLGLPLAVASTVPSVTHLMSLTTYTIEKLPEGRGERKVPVVVCEQRMTNLMIHVLLALSLLFAPVLKYVPKAVLFGVFLYMGIASLNGNELFERLLLCCIWDPKAYPGFAYVQHVRASRMHAYTLLQTVCLAILYGLKEVKQTAVVFPFFMASLMVIRKGFKYIFTEDDLFWLDGVHIEAEQEQKPEQGLTGDVALQQQPSPGQTGPWQRQTSQGSKAGVWQRETSQGSRAPWQRETSHDSGSKAPWQQHVEPDVDVPFGRGVTPLGKQEGPWSQNVDPGLAAPFGRGTTPMGL